MTWRLIVTAPELLAVCKSIAKADNQLEDDDYYDALRATELLAQKAIVEVRSGDADT